MTLQRTVLVTGAYGFLGRYAARMFARRGYTVIGMGHGRWTKDDWKNWGLSAWHETDLTLEALQRYAKAPDVLLHCAGSGSVSFSIENPLLDFDRTVLTTAQVLEYVRLYSPSSRVIYPSSASVYGVTNVLSIREDDPLIPISQYGSHKLMSEQLIGSYARQFGISTSIVRFFSLYGNGLRKQLLWDACKKFDLGDENFMGTGDEVRDWLHVEDAAELLFSAVEHTSPDCPVVNGGSGEGITVRDLLLHLGSCLLRKAVTVNFSGARRVGDPSRYVADIQRAKSWSWMPQLHWKLGVSEYVAWWRQT